VSRIARLLNRSAEVWRDTRVPDGMGGWTSGRSKVGTVRCRISQPSATERLAADQNGTDLSHVVYLLPTADVRRGDELRNAGRVFDVKAVYEPSVSDVYLRADCVVRQTQV
jgi:SPP1 family predicted phage head-tail adaptor